MKAIGIKMVELQPMFSGEARIKGYKVLESLGDNELGYEVTYLDIKVGHQKIQLMQLIINCQKITMVLKFLKKMLKTLLPMQK